jgi:ribosomal protein L29
MAKKSTSTAAVLGKEELTAKLATARTHLYTLRMKHQSNELKTPHEIRIARREVARLSTQLTFLKNS